MDTEGTLKTETSAFSGYGCFCLLLFSWFSLSAQWMTWKPSSCVNALMDGCACERATVFGHFSILLWLINLITGIVWFSVSLRAGRKHSLLARKKKIKGLLLQIIWFLCSFYSVRYDHPLWPKIQQKSCYSSPCDIEGLPLGYKECVCVCVWECTETERQRGRAERGLFGQL